MACEKCAALGWDHDEVVQRCRRSLFWTGLILCGFDKMSPVLHGALADEWFLPRFEAEKKRFLIMLHRGCLKTTVFTQAFITWMLINDPELRILFVMSATQEAQKKLDVVKGIFLSESMAHFFPHLVPDISRVKWSSTSMEIPRKSNWDAASVTAMGIDSRKVGGHYNIHIFDDLVDEKAPESEARIESAIKFLQRSNPLFVDRKTGLRMVIGTLWPGGFYEPLMDDERYEKVVLGDVIDDRYQRFIADVRDHPAFWRNDGNAIPVRELGTPVFPESETMETLEDCQRDMGSYDYAHQMRNELIEEGMKPFCKEDCQTYTIDAGGTAIVDDVFYPYSSMYRTLTIDPATGEGASSDESAIIVCGYVRGSGLAFVLDAWSGRVLSHELIKRTLDMAEKWSVDLLAPEDVAYQKTFKQFLLEKMRERRLNFSILPVKPGSKSKGRRIMDSLQPFIENHQVFFLQTDAQQRLVNELDRIQYSGGKVVIAGKSPNLADALSYHVQFWQRTVQKRDPLEIEWMDAAHIPDKTPKYGLRCVM